jgi:hypothetical protein
MPEFNELRSLSFERPHTPFPETTVEVTGPNPDETFSAPMEEPPEWIKNLITRRRTEVEQTEK